jgi:hypothetical protein
MERTILYRAINPSFYGRFIDYIISALSHTHAEEFIEMFHAINHSIHFDPSFITIRSRVQQVCMRSAGVHAQRSCTHSFSRA